MLKKIISKLNSIKEFKTQNDFEFFERVYNNGDLRKYINRLNAIGFSDLENVLDHGCGFGQWSFSLSELNKNITGYDIGKDRINIANKIKNKIDNENIFFTSKIDYDNPKLLGKYDAIFSYGVLQCLDYKEMLKSYYNLLKPKGRLYFTAADIGWFLYYIIDGHNDTKNYSTREWGIKALVNSLNYFQKGYYLEGENICIPYNNIKLDLEQVGFKIIEMGPDGSINFTKTKCEQFFPFEKYDNVAVYEVLCEKN